MTVITISKKIARKPHVYLTHKYGAYIVRVEGNDHCICTQSAKLALFVVAALKEAIR